MVAIASICSVTRMLPSSAAIALPARAVTMIALNTGAISRVSETATTPPTRPSALKARSAAVVWSARTMPLKVPVSATMKIDLHADEVHHREHLRHPERPAEEPDHRLRRERDDVADVVERVEERPEHPNEHVRRLALLAV